MKMKKGLALLLAACSCFAFAACEEDAPQEPEHEHAYATEWTKDETDHWHVCEGEDCTEIADKATHEWNAGEITTEASASANGVKTFTCTVCAQTKTESVPYVVDTEVTAEEWLAALSFTGVDNYEIVAASGGVEQTIRFDGTRVMTFGVNPSGGEIEQYYEKDGTNYYVYLVNAGVTQKEETTESSFFNAKTGGVAETFLASDFTYDAATKTYKAEEIVLFDGMVKYTDAEIKFENKKLVSMRYTYSFDNATPTAGTLDVTYGGVQTIEIPQV